MTMMARMRTSGMRRDSERLCGGRAVGSGVDEAEDSGYGGDADGEGMEVEGVCGCVLSVVVLGRIEEVRRVVG